MPGRLRFLLFWALIFLTALLARLSHFRVLWAEEGLPIAAGMEMARGQVLYRDIWFDKPPLLPAVYLLHQPWLLRFEGALYVLLVSVLIWRFALDKWGPREGRWAAALMAFFLLFDTPSALIPLAADLLMLAPHIGAVWLAWRGRAFWSGLLVGVAFLFNSKAVFVGAACALWCWRALPALAGGFLLPNLAAAGWLWWRGAFEAYIEQVWTWGRIYAGGTFVEQPVRNGLLRTANWLGFHAALVVAASAALLSCLPSRDRKGAVRITPDRWRFFLWGVLSFAAVAAGWRFFPRYYFQILPIAVLAASRGLVLLGRHRALALVLLLIPAVRFGPRYALLATGLSGEWADTAMDRDSRAAAAIVRGIARPGDSLFVWGFRPELYAYTDLPAAVRFLDSQPLTGVPADRHLTCYTPLAPELAAAHRAELTRSRPSIIMDGLGPLNAPLALERYPDLRDWLADYRVAGRTRMTTIYRRP